MKRMYPPHLRITENDLIADKNFNFSQPPV